MKERFAKFLQFVKVKSNCEMDVYFKLLLHFEDIEAILHFSRFYFPNFCISIETFNSTKTQRLLLLLLVQPNAEIIQINFHEMVEINCSEEGRDFICRATFIARK